MEENENSLDQITDAIQTLATGIPAPVTKNFWKMFGQLCTASIGVPVAHFEGMANVVKAKYEARAELIKKTGTSIQDKIDVPDAYGKAAVEKYATKILGHQANIDKIVQIATESLVNNPAPESEPAEISEEWLNEFEAFTKLKTSDDMQQMFGRILANEVRNPGNFSLKTIRIVSQLDHEVAKYFSDISSLILTLKESGRIVIAFIPSIRRPIFTNAIKEGDKVNEYKIKVLHEYGLIDTSKVSIKIQPHLSLRGFLFYGNKNLVLNEIIGHAAPQHLEGFGLTQSGAQLFSALTQEIDDDYLELLRSTFREMFYTLEVH